MSIERNESSGYTREYMSKLKYLDGLLGLAACLCVQVSMRREFELQIRCISGGLSVDETGVFLV